MITGYLPSGILVTVYVNGYSFTGRLAESYRDVTLHADSCIILTDATMDDRGGERAEFAVGRLIIPKGQLQALSIEEDSTSPPILPAGNQTA